MISKLNATNEVGEFNEASGNGPNERARPEDRLPLPVLANMDPLAGHIIVRLLNEVRALRNENRALRNANRTLRIENQANREQRRTIIGMLRE